MDVIKTADWIIDLGPEGGPKGGEILAEGPPEVVAANPRSFTGHFLAPMLNVTPEQVPAPLPASKPRGRKRRRRSNDRSFWHLDTAGLAIHRPARCVFGRLRSPTQHLSHVLRRFVDGVTFSLQIRPLIAPHRIGSENSRSAFHSLDPLPEQAMRPCSTILSLMALLCAPHAAAGQMDADSAASSDTLKICVVVDGALREIAAEQDTESGDTIVGGRPLADANSVTSTPYLAEADWYARDEMVLFEQRRYVRYGRARVLRPVVLTRVGEFRGIPLFAESRRDAVRFVYALVNAGCEFQPYWYAATVGEVRGR